MNFFFSNAFWGILLILWGASMVLKSFFPKINFPLGTIFVSICVIMLGVQLLFSSMGHKGSLFKFDNHKRNTTTTMNFEGISGNQTQELNAVFTNDSTDLSRVDVTENSSKFEVSAVFGKAIIYVSENTPIYMESSAVFGKVYKDNKLKPANGIENGLYIEANAVFGSVDIIVK